MSTVNDACYRCDIPCKGAIAIMPRRFTNLMPAAVFEGLRLDQPCAAIDVNRLARNGAVLHQQ